MARYEAHISISYGAGVIIDADSQEEADKLADEMGVEELWDLSIEQGDRPYDQDIELEYVQIYRK